MLNNIKLRECIAVNLLENSFSRLWWAFFIRFRFCARFLNLFWRFCCSCAILPSSSSSSSFASLPSSIDCLANVYALFFVYDFTCMPFNANPYSIRCELCGSNSFRFFSTYFCTRTSNVDDDIDIHLFGRDYICINTYNLKTWQAHANLFVSQVVSKWVGSLFQQNEIYSFAIAQNMQNCVHDKHKTNRLEN